MVGERTFFRFSGIPPSNRPPYSSHPSCDKPPQKQIDHRGIGDRRGIRDRDRSLPRSSKHLPTLGTRIDALGLSSISQQVSFVFLLLRPSKWSCVVLWFTTISGTKMSYITIQTGYARVAARWYCRRCDRHFDSESNLAHVRSYPFWHIAVRCGR